MIYEGESLIKVDVNFRYVSFNNCHCIVSPGIKLSKLQILSLFLSREMDSFKIIVIDEGKLSEQVATMYLLLR